ncbi:CGH_3_HP_G0015970.mRNA.1.CDS.1 [Saccharomyces cerevisiae]|nr:CGH_3_HP_G0015970.mRNA.1.CDS.1 [Saccharomyces cerevisiae]CAI4939197.1 CGH_1_HP_G0029860.mRNA.1.CDS.1 [Saccharomyces cerevisiae]CAI5010680.1 CGH_1_HP_G0084090.mRNA.1.CDS.1 [Saccharomyces cerevisiae]CAI5076704.1 CGH_1_HP_G0119620.mRNA.1.CDS.1 [Saccharomyces cerevisiae]CAI5129424.1 CGH_1_HP_G0005290.mRNA.1.CDS.1 [Saccharomyces cerevisiae]
MASTWKPAEDYVLQLATLLQNCMSPNPEIRNNAMEAMENFQLQPEFLNYLCYILIEGESDDVLKQHYSLQDLQNNRATAGMLLKNSMLGGNNLIKSNSHDLGYVKSNIIHGLYNSNNNLVSNVTGIVITTLFSTYYRQHRDDPTGLQMLYQLLELTSNGNEPSIKALSKIMEDSAQFFQLEWSGNTKPMEALLDSFFRFISNPNFSPVIRSESVKCINTVIPLQTQSFIVRLDKFLEIIFQLAQNDENDLVRAQICISFSFLLEFRPDKLVSHLDGIVQFMLHLITTVNEEKVAIEACEFLHAFATSPNIPEHILQPYVKDIVPILLSKMVYNEESIVLLEASNDDDAFLEDKDEDIKPIAPRIVKKKEAGNGEDADDNEDDDDDDDEDGDVDTQWNLRKCSAATLDVMTNILPHQVMDIAFPFLREHLGSDRWFIREATILALGAMAEGGMKYFNDGLPALIPFLVEQLNDKWAPVRKMTCWTLSRFSPWILQDHTEFLIPVLEPIINTLMDKKKDVQEAAISSVAVFIENADSELVETLFYSQLLTSFDKCLKYYKKKNLIILYDAIGRFSEKCALDETALQIILPPLIEKWALLSDSDKELWPLLECLSCVASSLGERFMPMAPEVYNRAFRILCHCVELEAKSHQDPTIVVPEKDFIITSLDLIDGLVQGLGAHSQDLLFPQGTKDLTILKIMLECLQDPVHEVRQSCFALLGDIVYFFNSELVIGNLEDFLKLIGTEIMHNDDSDGTPAVINAIWALGLISERIDLNTYIIDMSRIILDLFTTNTQIVDSSVMENLSVTIGKMGLTHPEVFSSGAFANDSNWNKWCLSVNALDDVEEKSSAYMGFLKIINLTSTEVTMSNDTIHKIVTGLSSNVEANVFAQEIYTFLMNHSAQISAINFTPDEISFLQQFTS